MLLCSLFSVMKFMCPNFRTAVLQRSSSPTINGFQKLEKIKDLSRQSRQLEELTEKMRECKRLIKEFERGIKGLNYTRDPHTSKILNEKKQSKVKELNSYVTLKKKYTSKPETKRAGPNEGYDKRGTNR